MNGPFNVGDVVVCVNVNLGVGRNPLPEPLGSIAMRCLRLGRCYRIARVDGTYGGLRLVGDTYPDVPGGYSHRRFRHLPKADEQFTEQMRALRPVHTGDPTFLVEEGEV